MSLPLRIVDCASESGLAALASRVPKPDEALEKSVAAIIQDVRTRGDEALLEIGQRFDSERLSSIKASDGGDPVEPSIETAYRRIFDFHLRQLEVLTASMQKDGRGWRWQMSPDLLIGQRLLPLQSVGIYAPGGRASYPSTVLMLAGPANAAGVDRVYLATPAAPDGEVDKGVMGAARVAQVSGAFKMGGAAAVAAFAFGTETVPRVDKIVGPGNRFLNEAKRQLWGSIGVDGLYGPSEVCVVVDETSNAAFAAADLLTQIEHAPDNAGFLISVSRSKLEEVLEQIGKQMEGAPRASIMREALGTGSMALLARNLDEAGELVNAIAPEHLTVSLPDPDSFVARVSNAGCILLGDWTPESAADYCIGPCHTLPTQTAARFAGPLNVMDFLKFQSFACLTKEQLEPLSRVVEAFGALEGFPAHARGATIRY